MKKTEKNNSQISIHDAGAAARANMLNKMAVTFLSQSQESFEAMMTEGVRLIADTIDIDRMSVWRNFTKPDGLHTSQIYRWDKESGGTTVPTAVLEDVTYTKFAPSWEGILSGGKTINGPIGILPKGETEMLKSFGVVSLFVTPIFINNAFWGFVLFEDRQDERYFEEELAEIMRSAAFLCANTVIRADDLRHIKETSKAKSEFLSNMSHEMRTPMNAIINMTVIGKNTDNLERKNYALDKIKDASTHLLGVINDVLDMSKIEAKKFELVPVKFNFEKMLSRVTNVINFRVEEKYQNLAVHIDKNIPEILIGDDQRITQIITNLLSNAVKFTPENGSISLNTKFLSEEDNVCTIQISVTDTGIGISKEHQARLFQSFQQAESNTARTYGGTGLGLSISRSFVEMMGGKIWVESAVGKGSTFIFTMQALRDKEAEESQFDNSAADDADQKENRNDFTGRRVLLVEDMEINREIVLMLLESTNLEIDCAENGIQAVDMFIYEPERYEIIFMDVHMPGMDGYEATQQIRLYEKKLKTSAPQHKPVPIIAMTANVFKEDIEKCLHAGMDDHLGKPLDMETVLKKLRYYLKPKKNEE